MSILSECHDVSSPPNLSDENLGPKSFAKHVLASSVKLSNPNVQLIGLVVGGPRVSKETCTRLAAVALIKPYAQEILHQFYVGNILPKFSTSIEENYKHQSNPTDT